MRLREHTELYCPCCHEDKASPADFNHIRGVRERYCRDCRERYAYHTCQERAERGTARNKPNIEFSVLGKD